MCVKRLTCTPFSFSTKPMKNKNITGELNPSLQEPSTATRDGSAEGAESTQRGRGQINIMNSESACCPIRSNISDYFNILHGFHALSYIVRSSSQIMYFTAL